MASPTINDQLLRLVRQRGEVAGVHNAGILTADRYAKTLQQCVGSDLCYRYAAKGSTSYQDIIKSASKKLTYNDPTTLVIDEYKNAKELLPSGLELPKNTLMVFQHKLTTPREDRDKDVLMTQGARPDLKMLMLWQHVHTLPIGKLLAVVEHTKDVLRLISCIIDLNELSHDAAVMIDNDMGRYSHGFRALSYEERKAPEGEWGGFKINEFEIMEESLVSVPSNVDAETEDVLLSLAGGKQFKSAMMKEACKRISDARNTTVNVPFEEKSHEDEHAECSCQGGKDASDSTPEEADANADTEAAPKATDDTKVVECPECGAPMENGKCTKCNYVEEAEGKSTPDDDKGTPDDDKSAEGDVKRGRVLSKANRKRLEDVKEDLEEIHGSHCESRSGKALCKSCISKVDDVLKSDASDSGDDDEDGKDVTVNAETAMTIFLASSSNEQQKSMMKALATLDAIRQMKNRTASLIK